MTTSHLRVDRDARESSDSSAPSERRWDDAPEDETVSSDNTVAAVLRYVKRIRDTSVFGEVSEVLFSTADTFLAASVVSAADGGSHSWPTVEMPRAVYVWRTKNFLCGRANGYSYPINLGTVRTTGPLAFSGLPDNMLAVPDIPRGAAAAGLDTYDLEVSKRRKSSSKAALRPPLAWSPDGALLAGASNPNPSRIVVVDAQTQKPVMVIPNHSAELTHLAFTLDGAALVSIAKDGFVRMTSTRTGQTLGTFEVESRSPPALMRVSPDGELVASVWGRDVMLWYPRTGVVDGYRLAAVRTTEGWPLCISPDCRFLACRTETGFDVADLATGKLLAEVTSNSESSFVTAASFSSDGSWLAVGKHSGSIQLYSFGLVRQADSR